MATWILCLVVLAIAAAACVGFFVFSIYVAIVDKRSREILVPGIMVGILGGITTYGFVNLAVWLHFHAFTDGTIHLGQNAVSGFMRFGLQAMLGM